MPRGARPAPASCSAGFTLIELMVVVLVMGAVLLLIPANMEGLGARGKFIGTANSLVAAFTGARERAILDAYEVALQLGTFRNEDGDYEHGWRFRFTNIPAGKDGDARRRLYYLTSHLKTEGTAIEDWKFLLVEASAIAGEDLATSKTAASQHDEYERKHEPEKHKKKQEEKAKKALGYREGKGCG